MVVTRILSRKFRRQRLVVVNHERKIDQAKSRASSFSASLLEALCDVLRVEPSELAGQSGEVALVGIVAGHPSGDSHGAGLRFRMRDVDGQRSVPVVYRGSVPDLFRTGRSVHVTGELRDGVFVGKPDTLLTRCPSKYSPKQA